MNRKTDMTEEEYQELVRNIEEHSQYQMKPSLPKKWMTVTEMGDLLGLKKTDRYWLVHKNVFESKKIAGKEPGQELNEWSFSARDIAHLLGITEAVAYDLIKREKIDTVKVDYWNRIPKEVFWNWYNNQSRYQTVEDRKAKKDLYAATISMPEIAKLLGISRKAVYTILKSRKYGKLFETVVIADQKRITKESFQKFLNEQDEYQLDPSNDYEELSKEENIALATFRRKKLLETGNRRSNGNLNYLTPEEATMMAKVSRSTVVNWYQQEEFPIIYVGNRIRIRRREFEKWLKERNRVNGIHSRKKS